MSSTARVTHSNNCITINPGGWKDVSITCYTNGEIEDFAYISTNGGDLTPPKPSWKRAYAIEEAKKYATAFLGNFPPTILATPFVEYRTQMISSPYFTGAWTVFWRRTDNAGHPFLQDKISVKIHEKEGIEFLLNDWATEYAEETGPFIEEGKAIELSEAPSQILPKLPAYIDYFQINLKAVHPHSDGLWILTPNNIFHATTPELVADVGTAAKLGWRIEYELLKPDGTRFPLNMEIWIDAKTGELLGGK
jgi:hypothetical protein